VFAKFVSEAIIYIKEQDHALVEQIREMDGISDTYCPSQCSKAQWLTTRTLFILTLAVFVLSRKELKDTVAVTINRYRIFYANNYLPGSEKVQT